MFEEITIDINIDTSTRIMKMTMTNIETLVILVFIFYPPSVFFDIEDIFLTNISATILTKVNIHTNGPRAKSKHMALMRFFGTDIKLVTKNPMIDHHPNHFGNVVI
jgi:hypothetical protein